MSSRLLFALAVALLMPLIVAGGVLALAGLLSLSASRRVLMRTPSSRRAARTSKLHLETPAAEATLSHAT